MDEFFKRKECMVIKDFETAFKCYDKLVSKIIGIRQWTVTIMIALMLFTLREGNINNVLFPVIVSFVVFLIMELRERSSMKFDKRQIINLENIFSLEDENEYMQKIKDYVFRDIYLSKLTKWTKIIHFLKSMKKSEVIIWYAMWLIIWGFILFIFKICPNLFN